MKVVIDIEANGLENPTEIWCICCKDLETKQTYVFRHLTKDTSEYHRFLIFSKGVTQYVGHNFLGYDYPVLNRLLGLSVDDVSSKCVDTLIVSKLLDYSRPQGHSIEAYGEDFGLVKLPFSDFSRFSPEMEEYCARDVDICEKIYLKYKRQIVDPDWQPSLLLEHQFQLIVNSLHDNGFSFNVQKAERLLEKVSSELAVLDKAILEQFPPQSKLIREIHPVETKYGTIHRKDFRWVHNGDLSEFNGGPFSRFEWEAFNPSSHKAIIGVLYRSGWRPEDKTKTSIEVHREIGQLKHKKKTLEVDLRLKELYTKKIELDKYGWRVNETNLNTLPPKAPLPARTLAKRILVESRRRTLTEWLGLVQKDGRIHGKFYPLGAWTHRMAHQSPNTANIPTEKKLYGKQMRSLWQAPPEHLLVGVDAETIQLRIFAHYIDDLEFTEALIRGKKEDKTDAHSLNQRIIGKICKTRGDAKNWVYAVLLGAGIPKLAAMLGCTEDQAREALSRISERYSGFDNFKREVIPLDARRGWFIGLDGRKVRIPGDTDGSRKHLVMSGYLQAGEAVVMKKACLYWHNQLIKDEVPFTFVNFVHDEWQTECPNDMKIAMHIAKIQADSLRIVGEELGLKCPLAGSFFNEDLKDYTIHTTWAYTH